jgi:phytanoyl-CoA hydroxylase
MKVVIEPTIAEHPPQLYRSSRIADKVDGFEQVDAARIEQYDSQGFLVIGGAYTPKEVADARDTLGDMTRAVDPRCDSVYYEGLIREHLPNARREHQSADGNFRMADLALGDIGDQLPSISSEVRARYVRKFAGFTRTHDALHALANKPSLLGVIEQIIGEPIREFQDMAMIKPPRGREKPWHQDHAYFNFPEQTRVVGVWIALDRVTPENGCMYLLSGGHKQGPRPHFMRRDWQICDNDMLGSESVCAMMEPGDALLFDAKLPHGTPTNQSDEFRWAIQLHYVPLAAVEVDESVRLGLFGNEGKNVSC